MDSPASAPGRSEQRIPPVSIPSRAGAAVPRDGAAVPLSAAQGAAAAAGKARLDRLGSARRGAAQLGMARPGFFAAGTPGWLSLSRAAQCRAGPSPPDARPCYSRGIPPGGAVTGSGRYPRRTPGASRVARSPRHPLGPPAPRGSAGPASAPPPPAAGGQGRREGRRRGGRRGSGPAPPAPAAPHLSEQRRLRARPAPAPAPSSHGSAAAAAALPGRAGRRLPGRAGPHRHRRALRRAAAGRGGQPGEHPLAGTGLLWGRRFLEGRCFLEGRYSGPALPGGTLLLGGDAPWGAATCAPRAVPGGAVRDRGGCVCRGVYRSASFLLCETPTRGLPRGAPGREGGVRGWGSAAASLCAGSPRPGCGGGLCWLWPIRPLAIICPRKRLTRSLLETYRRSYFCARAFRKLCLQISVKEIPGIVWG